MEDVLRYELVNVIINTFFLVLCYSLWFHVFLQPISPDLVLVFEISDFVSESPYNMFLTLLHLILSVRMKKWNILIKYEGQTVSNMRTTHREQKVMIKFLGCFAVLQVYFLDMRLIIRLKNILICGKGKQPRA